MYVLEVKQQFGGIDQNGKIKHIVLRRRVGQQALALALELLNKNGDLQALSDKAGTGRRGVIGICSNMKLPKSIGKGTYPANKLVSDAKQSPGAAADLGQLTSVFNALDDNDVTAVTRQTRFENNSTRPATRWAMQASNTRVLWEPIKKAGKRQRRPPRPQQQRQQDDQQHRRRDKLPKQQRRQRWDQTDKGETNGKHTTSTSLNPADSGTTNTNAAKAPRKDQRRDEQTKQPRRRRWDQTSKGETNGKHTTSTSLNPAASGTTNTNAAKAPRQDDADRNNYNNNDDRDDDNDGDDDDDNDEAINKGNNEGGDEDDGDEGDDDGDNDNDGHNSNHDDDDGNGGKGNGTKLHKDLPVCDDPLCGCARTSPVPRRYSAIQSNGPRLACLLCDHNLKNFDGSAAVLRHMRTCCPHYGDALENGQLGWIEAYYDGVNECDKCGEHYKSLGGHIGKCNGKKQRQRQVAAPIGYGIQLSDQQAGAVVQLLNPVFLGTPRRSIKYQASKRSYRDAVGQLRRVQAGHLHEHTATDPTSVQSRAAAAILIATQQVLAAPGSDENGKATKTEINNRINCIATNDWTTIKELLTNAEKPVKARSKQTDEEAAAAKAKRCAAAIQNNQIAKGFGALCTKGTMTDCVEGVTDHLECLNATDDEVNRRDHLQNVINAMPEEVRLRAQHKINLNASRAAVWKLNTGTAIGADGFGVNDLRAFPDVGRAQILHIIANGRAPMDYAPLMAGGYASAISKPKKEGATTLPVRTIVPGSLWFRANGKSLHATATKAIKRATGNHQGAVGQKFGAGQIQISAEAHLAQHEFGARAMSDLTAGFPNTVLNVAAKVVAEHCPELYGHFCSCYNQAPLIQYTEIGTDNTARLKTTKMEDGLIQGEALSSDVFTILGKEVRDDNNSEDGSTRTTPQRLPRRRQLPRPDPERRRQHQQKHHQHADGHEGGDNAVGRQVLAGQDVSTSQQDVDTRHDHRPRDVETGWRQDNIGLSSTPP